MLCQIKIYDSTLIVATNQPSANQLAATIDRPPRFSIVNTYSFLVLKPIVQLCRLSHDNDKSGLLVLLVFLCSSQ
jgi:hypothetical protein